MVINETDAQGDKRPDWVNKAIARGSHVENIRGYWCIVGSERNPSAERRRKHQIVKNPRNN